MHTPTMSLKMCDVDKKIFLRRLIAFIVLRLDNDNAGMN